MSTPSFGTFAWGHLRGGRLTRLEAILLVAQGIRFRVGRSIRDLKPGAGHTTSVERVAMELPALPDSRIAKDAEELVRGSSSIALLHHTQRTYLWGACLATRNGINFDAELLYVASLLHDLGLTEAYGLKIAAAQCFAYEGAVHAREFASQAAWDEARCDALANAICLHLNVTVDLKHGPEAHLLHAGAGYDVLGTRIHELGQTIRKNALDAYPRFRMKQELVRLLHRQNRHRTHCRCHLYSKLGFLDAVQKAPFDESTDAADKAISSVDS